MFLLAGTPLEQGVDAQPRQPDHRNFTKGVQAAEIHQDHVDDVATEAFGKALLGKEEKNRLEVEKAELKSRHEKVPVLYDSYVNNSLARSYKETFCTPNGYLTYLREYSQKREPFCEGLRISHAKRTETAEKILCKMDEIVPLVQVLLERTQT